MLLRADYDSAVTPQRLFSGCPAITKKIVIGETDGVYSSWATAVPDGFSDSQIAALKRIAPYLALAIKSVSLARMTRTLDGDLSLPRPWPARAKRANRARTNRRRRLVQ